MRTLPALALGLAAAGLAGTAIAASQQHHRLDIPLPDGGVVHVDYVGDVAPKVTVAPAQSASLGAQTDFPGFGNFDAMVRGMERQARQIEQMARQAPGAAGVNVASFGTMPEGSSSISIVSTSNGGVSCTRTTEVVSQGAAKPPKVTSNVSGNCGGMPRAAPAAPGKPIDRT